MIIKFRNDRLPITIAKRTDYFWLLTIDDGDVFTQTGAERNMVVSVENKSPAREHLPQIEERRKFPAVLPLMDHNGNPDHAYYTCGQDHDKRNRDWKPFQLLERQCEESGYDFLEARDMIEEQVGRKLMCECQLLNNER